MITDYVTEIDNWEDWQKQYRYGVILIIPPDPPREQVNAFRTQYDPRAQSYCEAHISLTVPLPGPVTEAHWNELESIASAVSPFTIRYGPLIHYPPHPGVCLAIEPRETLEELLIRLEAAPAFAGAPSRFFPFSPHLTLAELITVKKTQELMEELKDIAPTGSFLCNGLSYTVPDGDFHFTERRRLEFSGRR